MRCQPELQWIVIELIGRRTESANYKLIILTELTHQVIGRRNTKSKWLRTDFINTYFKKEGGRMTVDSDVLNIHSTATKNDCIAL